MNYDFETIERAVVCASSRIKRDDSTNYLTLDDMKQECFLWALENRRYLENFDARRLFAYVYVSSVNRLKKILSASSRRLTLGGYQDAISSSYSSRDFELLHKRRELVRAYLTKKSKFAKKSSAVDTIIVLTLDNVSVADIARRIGRSVESVSGSIRAFVKRARRDLVPV